MDEATAAVSKAEFVRIEGKTLRDALKWTAAFSGKASLPILNSILLTVSQGFTEIRATDLDHEITVAVDDMDAQGEWSICIPLHNLSSIASAAGASPITITPTKFEQTVISRVEKKSDTKCGVRIEIGDGEAVYDIPYCLPADDFPQLRPAQMHELARFSNGRFAELLSKVSWSMSLDETRYYLNGVSWKRNQEGQRFAATDGHRLAMYQCDSEPCEPAEYIIQRDTVHYVCQMLKRADITIFAPSEPNSHILEIKTHGLKLRFKTIDGTFPDIGRVIPRPESVKFEFKFRKDELLNSIKLASAISIRSDRQAIRFQPKAGRIQVSLKNSDDGTVAISTSREWPEGAEPFGFNSKYLQQIGNSCNGDIEIGMIDHGAPFLFKDADPDMTRVLMPMRV